MGRNYPDSVMCDNCLERLPYPEYIQEMEKKLAMAQETIRVQNLTIQAQTKQIEGLKRMYKHATPDLFYEDD